MNSDNQGNQQNNDWQNNFYNNPTEKNQANTDSSLSVENNNPIPNTVQANSQPVINSEIQTNIVVNNAQQSNNVIQENNNDVQNVTSSDGNEKKVDDGNESEKKQISESDSKKNDLILFIFFFIVVIGVIACLLYMIGIIGPKRANKRAKSSSVETKEVEKKNDDESQGENETEKKDNNEDLNTFSLNKYKIKIPDGYSLYAGSLSQDYVFLSNNSNSNYFISFTILHHMSLEKTAGTLLSNADSLNESTAYTLNYAEPTYEKFNGNLWLVYNGTYKDDGTLITDGYTYFAGAIVKVTFKNNNYGEHIKLMEKIDAILREAK